MSRTLLTPGARLALLLGLLSGGCLVNADTKLWDGGPGGNGSEWMLNANWSQDGVPTIGDDIFLDNSLVNVPASLTISNGSMGAQTITFASGFNAANTTTIGNGGSTAATLTIGGAGTGANPLILVDCTSGTITFDKRNGGTADLGIALGATSYIEVNSGATLAINCSVSGPQGFSKWGAGRLILGGNNSFSGQAEVYYGQLRISDARALGTDGTIIQGGNYPGRLELFGGIPVTNYLFLVAKEDTAGAHIVNIEGNNTLSGMVILSGSTGGSNWVFQSDGGKLIVASGLGSSTTGDRILTLQGDTGEGEIQSVIGNGAATSVAVIKNGSGTWTLSGNNTYSGGTTNKAGILLVNGSIGSGSVVVNNSATLGGSGTINGPVTVQASGTLSPGTSLGTLTINNSLILAGNTAMEINKSGASLTSDLVKGVSTLTYGGTLTVTAAGDPLAANDSFNLFDATTFTGSFAVLNLPALPSGLTWDTSRLAVDGTLRVVATVTIAGTIKHYNGTQAVPGTVVTLSGDASQTVTTGTDGSYLFTVNRGGNYTVTPSRASDNPPSAGVTAADITLIRRHILGLGLLNSPYKIIAADVNGSKSVTAADITLIRRLILGLANTFPVGLWKFVPSDFDFSDPANPWTSPFATNRTYSTLVSDVTGQDYVAMKLGDVNGSWVYQPTGLAGSPQTFSKEVVSKSLLATPRTTFSARQQTVLPGQIVSVPIIVTGFRRVTSVQFTLGWDPAVLQFLSVGNFGLPGLSGANFNNQPADKLRVVWDDSAGTGVTVSDGASIFSVEFQAIGTNGAVSPVAFEDDPVPRELTVDAEVTPADWRNGTVQIENIQPRCVSIRAEAAGAYRITFAGAAGRIYTVQYSESLTHPNWLTLGTRTADSQGFFEYRDIPPADSNSRFYRSAYP